MFKSKITLLTQKCQEALERCFSIVMKIPQDKMGHFIVGNILSTIVLSLCLVFGINVFLSIVISVVLTSSVAFAKEAYDRANKDKHTYDSNDAFATIVGGCVAVMPWCVALVVVWIGYLN